MNKNRETNVLESVELGGAGGGQFTFAEVLMIVRFCMVMFYECGFRLPLMWPRFFKHF